MLGQVACRSLAFVCAAGFVTAMSAVTVDFGTAFATLPYTEDGLTFSDVTGTSPASIGGFGSEKALVAGTNFVPIHVRAAGTQPFDLISLDIETIGRTWRIESSSGAIFNPTTVGTINFSGSSGWSGIDFFDIIHNPAEANGSIQFDNVAFNFVPEPSTLALVVFCGVSALLRRR